ncbi:competence protein CoiA [Mariniradius sediminis]|uniref:Competence protein CoiA-like N-terminal domain-containing protein n=1 Tax=Mariniradius sediminis TaxID=2909237 RepID=A0ABS9BW36_9BACT|nr:competence protein CoiA family protein [Mariniradius sediminis]MCF1751386.1 hypothetical protein [Mariniradius sediminis]
MIWALVNNEKIEATPGARGTCPICNGKLLSKCGAVIVWHWAHFKDENCDSWYEPESFWHKHWKMTFGKENAEIGIEKEGKRHIADIRTVQNVIIELQNSPISMPVIKEREDFYGERMLWLINGEDFKKNLSVKDYWEDEDYLELKSLPRPPVRWVRRSEEIKKEANGEFFYWKSPRKSWANVQRHLFIDFGEDSLFLVQGGMGTSQIRGVYISKEKFIRKYGGDYEYYRQNLIDK